MTNVQYKKKNNTESRELNSFIYVVLNRWVGIESVVLMTKKNTILNYDLLKESFKEKKNNDFSFYEKIYTRNIYRSLTGRTFGIILPGIIAFLYYPGSYIFLFLSLYIIIFFLVFLEKILIKISNGNLILVSIITNIIVYRLIHFGYVPRDSYLLFGSLFLTLFIYFVSY